MKPKILLLAFFFLLTLRYPSSLMADSSFPNVDQLFKDAEFCGNWYRCEPYNQIMDLLSTPQADLVLESALKIMENEPDWHRRRLLVRSIVNAINYWISLKKDSGRFDLITQKRLLDRFKMQLYRKPAECEQRLRIYVILSSKNWDVALIDALFRSEIEDSHGCPENERDAAEVLGERQQDMKLVSAWAASGRDNLIRAVVVMLSRMDQRKIKAIPQEKQMILKLAGLKLPIDAAHGLLDLIEIFDSSDLLPALKQLARSPDSELQQRAEKIAKQVQNRKKKLEGRGL